MPVNRRQARRGDMLARQAGWLGSGASPALSGRQIQVSGFSAGGGEAPTPATRWEAQAVEDRIPIRRGFNRLLVD